MKRLFQKLAAGLREMPLVEKAKTYLRTPVGKIFVVNSIMFGVWNMRGVSESFLVQNFSFERYNIKNNRLYTTLTYAFSHFSFVHYVFNMAALHFIGRQIQKKYGQKYIWWLYLTGAVMGSIFMNSYMPYDSIVLPKVGADSGISALFSFACMLNPRMTIFSLFGFPFKLWFLLGFMAVLAYLADPTRKAVGGMATGVLLALLFKRKVI